jgi:hypothetical protein
MTYFAFDVLEGRFGDLETRIGAIFTAPIEFPSTTSGPNAS